MKSRLSLVLIVIVSSTQSLLQAASPTLSNILPRGVQRGAETVVTMSGARLDDAEEIFFYRPGVQATKI
jgi:hypothetical protein